MLDFVSQTLLRGEEYCGCDDLIFAPVEKVELTEAFKAATFDVDSFLIQMPCDEFLKDKKVKCSLF